MFFYVFNYVISIPWFPAKLGTYLNPSLCHVFTQCICQLLNYSTIILIYFSPSLVLDFISSTCLCAWGTLGGQQAFVEQISEYPFCCLIRIVSTARPLPLTGSGLNSTPACTCDLPKLYSILEMFLWSGF